MIKYIVIHFHPKKLRKKKFKNHKKLDLQFSLPNDNCEAAKCFFCRTKSLNDLIKYRHHKNIGTEQARAIAHTLTHFIVVSTIYAGLPLRHTLLDAFMLSVACCLFDSCTRTQANRYLFWPQTHAHAHIISLA